MLHKNSNILILIFTELQYNRILIILPVSLLILVILIVQASIALFNVEEPVYIISPALIIGSFTAGIWINRIKEQREFLYSQLPVRRNERGLARVFTYLMVIVFLFIITIILNEILYNPSELYISNPISDIFIIFAILELSLIVQDFRYCIKSKYDRFWIPLTLILLLAIISPFVLFFIYTINLSIHISINNNFMAAYGISLLLLSVFIYNKRKSFLD